MEECEPALPSKCGPSRSSLLFGTHSHILTVVCRHPCHFPNRLGSILLPSSCCLSFRESTWLWGGQG